MIFYSILALVVASRHWDSIPGHQTQWLGRNKIMITSKKNFSHHHEKILEPYIWRQWWDFTIQF